MRFSVAEVLEALAAVGAQQVAGSATATFEGAAIDVFDGAVNVPGLSAFSRSVAPRRPVLTREAASIAAPETDAASPTAAPTQNP